MSDYSKKLKDPRWQKKRLEILNRDKFRCFLCDRKDLTLYVHHVRYTAKDPWDEDSKNLITLCENCHEYEQQNLDDHFKEFGDFVKENGIPKRIIISMLKAIHKSYMFGYKTR